MNNDDFIKICILSKTRLSGWLRYTEINVVCTRIKCAFSGKVRILKGKCVSSLSGNHTHVEKPTVKS